jgi:hypothetical protein
MRNDMTRPFTCKSSAVLQLLMAVFFIAPPGVTSALDGADRGAIKQNAVAGALQAALAKNILHAREWLDQKDYKSLAQSAGGLHLLAELLKAQGDNAAWQQVTDKLVSAARDVGAAAKEEKTIQCQAALDTLEKLLAGSSDAAPTGQPRPIEKPPAIRPLMLTMDALAADAKIALMTGNADAAKKQAVVLSALGKLVSNSRSGDAWHKMAADFCQATEAAATTPDSDPKAVRQFFRTIAERCEACHETRGR